MLTSLIKNCCMPCIPLIVCFTSLRLHFCSCASNPEENFQLATRLLDQSFAIYLAQTTALHVRISANANYIVDPEGVVQYLLGPYISHRRRVRCTYHQLRIFSLQLVFIRVRLVVFGINQEASQDPQLVIQGRVTIVATSLTGNQCPAHNARCHNTPGRATSPKCAVAVVVPRVLQQLLHHSFLL